MDTFKFELWPTNSQEIWQLFGQNPQKYVALGLPGHDGVDIASTFGAPVFAVAAGVVVAVRQPASDDSNRYGVSITIEHADDIRTTYAHLGAVTVNQGAVVAAGDPIAQIGLSGDSTFPHLLFILHDPENAAEGYPDEIADPLPLLLPLLGWAAPEPPLRQGWAYLPSLTVFKELAQVSFGGTVLRTEPSLTSKAVGFLRSGTVIALDGLFDGQFAPVQVAANAIKPVFKQFIPILHRPPRRIEGWVAAEQLTIANGKATVGSGGALLLAAADAAAEQLGRIDPDTVIGVRGETVNNFVPVHLLNTLLQPLDPRPRPVTVKGWAPTGALTFANLSARVRNGGVTLFEEPDQGSVRLGFIPAANRVAVIGAPEGFFTPVQVRKSLLRPASGPPPAVTAGWAPTGGLVINGNRAIARTGGVTLREGPDKRFGAIGFVAAGAAMTVNGASEALFTPVIVRNTLLQPVAPVPVQPPLPLAPARFGLHASADPLITEAEHREFTDARVGIIKVLSFHNREDVRRLARAHRNAAWIVRPFLEFRQDGKLRDISPARFFQDTIADVERTLKELPGRDVVIELHNEPNVVPEGLALDRSRNWWDGGSWANWLSELLRLYRRRMPGMRFIYPGLSPGSNIANLRLDHVRFIEQSRWVVEACDGLAVHIYWSRTFSMQRALAVLDDYIVRFPNIPIWVTEASTNEQLRNVQLRANQYIDFWQQLKRRPSVRGVTYFVASASDPRFANEVWVGTGIGKLVGRR